MGNSTILKREDGTGYIMVFVAEDSEAVAVGVRRQSILDTGRKKIRCVSGLCFVDIKQPFVVGTTAF